MAAICQNPAPLLEVGGTVQSTLGPDAQPIYTPVLGTEVSDSTVVGVPFRFEVGESGFVHLDLKSFDFDAYLVLYDSDGVVLLEDDDGLINSHSRLVFEAEVGQEYQVMACALFDGRGKFSLQLSSGKPKEYTLSEKWKLEAINFRERISHLEGKGVDKAKDLASPIPVLGCSYTSMAILRGQCP